MPPNQLDLSASYWGGLAMPWHRTGSHLGDFAAVRESAFDGIHFDARGIVHIYGKNDEGRGMQFPKQYAGIQVGREVKRMHVLHAAREGSRTRTSNELLASYTLIYQDGSRHDFPVRDWVEVVDCLDFRNDSKSQELNQRLGMVWSGDAHYSGRRAHEEPQGCVFKTTFTNPHPGKRVESLELWSAEGGPGVMVLGITVE